MYQREAPGGTLDVGAGVVGVWVGDALGFAVGDGDGNGPHVLPFCI